MKKFLAALMVVFAVVLFGCITAAPAQATPNSISVDVAKAAPTFVTESVTPVTSAPNVIGVGGIKPYWRYVSCYWAMNGAKYCWRYSCTYFERVALGCYDGWYRVTIWYA